METDHRSRLGAAALSELRMGQTGVIRSVDAAGTARNRLLDLGFLPGTPVTAVRRAPFGDPTSFKIRGAVLALRAQDSSLVTVTATQIAEPSAQAKTAMQAKTAAEAEPC